MVTKKFYIPWTKSIIVHKRTYETTVPIYLYRGKKATGQVKKYQKTNEMRQNAGDQ